MLKSLTGFGVDAAGVEESGFSLLIDGSERIALSAEALSSFTEGFLPFSELLSLDNWSCSSNSTGLGGETELFALSGVLSMAAKVDNDDDDDGDVLDLLILLFDGGSIGSIQSHKNSIFRAGEIEIIR